MDCLTGTSVHGIFQPRVLKWVATAFSTMDMSLSKLREMVKDRKARVLQFMRSKRVGHN